MIRNSEMDEATKRRRHQRPRFNEGLDLTEHLLGFVAGLLLTGAGSLRYSRGVHEKSSVFGLAGGARHGTLNTATPCRQPGQSLQPRPSDQRDILPTEHTKNYPGPPPSRGHCT